MTRALVLLLLATGCQTLSPRCPAATHRWAEVRQYDDERRVEGTPLTVPERVTVYACVPRTRPAARYATPTEPSRHAE